MIHDVTPNLCNWTKNSKRDDRAADKVALKQAALELEVGS